MKPYEDETYESLYTHLEKLKEKATRRALPILNYCQECICDQALKFLPSEVELREGSVVFSFEEDNGDHLMLTFDKEGCDFNDPCINGFSFQKGILESKNELNWKDAVAFINEWEDAEL